MASLVLIRLPYSRIVRMSQINSRLEEYWRNIVVQYWKCQVQLFGIPSDECHLKQASVDFARLPIGFRYTKWLNKDKLTVIKFKRVSFDLLFSFQQKEVPITTCYLSYV